MCVFLDGKSIFNKIEQSESVSRVSSYSRQTFGSLVIHSTDGTTSATTNIDIATPIKDKEEQAMKNKK